MPRKPMRTLALAVGSTAASYVAYLVGDPLIFFGLTIAAIYVLAALQHVLAPFLWLADTGGRRGGARGRR